MPQGFLALRIRGDNGAAAAILAAVAYHATAARIAYLSQGKTIDVKSVRQDRVEVKYLDGAGVFPAGIQPAYALKDGYLVLASSPEAVRRFGAAAGAKPSGEVPLMRLSAKALSTYLTERRDALIPIIAERNNLSKEDAGKRLDGLLAGLQLLDRYRDHASIRGRQDVADTADADGPIAEIIFCITIPNMALSSAGP